MTARSEFNFPAIYTIANKITGTTYVGQTENVRIRWATHRRCLRRNQNTRNSYLQRAWNKYGENNFIFEVVFRFLSVPREQLQIFLDEVEILILKEYKNNCYNLMEAGISGMVASEITRDRLSQHNKQQWQKPEHRAKISASQKAAWNEPGRKAERIAQYKKAFKTDNYKQKRQKILKEAWAEGGFLRETQSAVRKANWQDPKYIAKQKESRQKAWQDPEVKKRRIESIKKAWEKRKAKLMQPVPSQSSPSDSKS